jgi:hypothetical protein
MLLLGWGMIDITFVENHEFSATSQIPKLQTLLFLRTYFFKDISFSSFSAPVTYLSHTASYWNHLFSFCISYLIVIPVKFSHNPIGKEDVV